MRIAIFLTAILLCPALSGCLCRGTGTCAEAGDGSTDPTAAVQAVFDSHCVVCHAGAGSVAEPDLRADGLLSRLENQPAAMCPTATDPLVTPGDPDHSYLYEKVSSATPRCGTRMPQGTSALAGSDLAAIHDWIAGMSTTAP